MKPSNGKLIIEVPADMNEKDVNVVIVCKENLKENWADLPGAQRLEILKKFMGNAKYPDVETNKYDVYDQ